MLCKIEQELIKDKQEDPKGEIEFKETTKKTKKKKSKKQKDHGAKNS